MLVGGSALAGFYLGHRSSDDLDLFSSSPPAHRATVLAVRSLERLGAELSGPYASEQYFHVDCALEGHRFTVDAVLDPALFRVGRGHELEGGIRVASRDTLLRSKAATLVSRCSEKDLYDLIWILEDSELDIGELLSLGAELDTGVDAEAVLISVTGASLSEQACGFGFAPEQIPRRIFEEISRFRQVLINDLQALLEAQPVPPLGQAIRKLRRLVGQKRRKR